MYGIQGATPARYIHTRVVGYSGNHICAAGVKHALRAPLGRIRALALILIDIIRIGRMPAPL
jgi:hypothetical protein